MKVNWKRPSKYKNTPTHVDGWRFDSKREATRYSDLKMLKEFGEIEFFLRQVPFHLPGNIKYIVDFVIFWKDGRVTFEDVKGMETDTFKLKKKLVEDVYPVEIDIKK